MRAAHELRDPAGILLAALVAGAASLTGLPPGAAVGVGAAVLATRTVTALWLDQRTERRAAAVAGPMALVPAGAPLTATPAPSAGGTEPQAPTQTRQTGPPAAAPATPVPAPAPAPAASANVFRAEGEYWTIGYRGSTFRLKDAKGLRYLHRMLADPGREFHVADLVFVPGEPCGHEVPPRRLEDEGLTRVPSSDAGTVLDPEAKAAYRRRLEDLQDEADEARSWGDVERAARAEDEIAALANELARAVGLHGRDRKARAASERARVNVTRAVKAALDRIAEHDRPLGHHLTSTVRTGTYCCYTPAPDDPPVWEL